MKNHQLSHLDYEGYGNYEFSGGPLGLIPTTGLPLTQLPDVHEMVTDDGGLTVVKLNYQKPVMDALNTTHLQEDHDSTVMTIMGTASFIAFSSGDNWASGYVNQGYAVLVDPMTLETGVVRVVVTTDPKTIVFHAAPTVAGGGYVVVAAPPALLSQAKALIGVIPPVVPPGTQPPGTQPPATYPPGTQPPGTQPPAVQPAKAETPDWMWPTIIGAGVLAAIALVASAKR